MVQLNRRMLLRFALALPQKYAYKGRMKFKFLDDKIFYPAAAALALLLIMLSLVWPQGLGLPSPAPFGHAIQLPDYFRMIHDRETRKRKAEADRAARERASAEAQKTAAAVIASQQVTSSSSSSSASLKK